MADSVRCQQRLIWCAGRSRVRWQFRAGMRWRRSLAAQVSRGLRFGYASSCPSLAGHRWCIGARLRFSSMWRGHSTLFNRHAWLWSARAYSCAPFGVDDAGPILLIIGVARWHAVSASTGKESLPTLMADGRRTIGPDAYRVASGRLATVKDFWGMATANQMDMYAYVPDWRRT